MKVYLLAESLHLGSRNHIPDWGDADTRDERWHHYQIHHRDDKSGKLTKNVGYVRGKVSKHNPDHFHIGYVAINHSKAAAREADDVVGKRSIRHSVHPEGRTSHRDVHHLMKQLRKKIPGLRRISGARISGAKVRNTGLMAQQSVRIPESYRGSKRKKIVFGASSK